MSDAELIVLIQAEIDGELDAVGRPELARRLLADPGARTERDKYQRLAGYLDALPAAEPPASLVPNVLAALPHAQFRPRAWVPQWRLAAMLAGVLIAGTLVFEMLKGPGPGSGELVGTIGASASMTMLDTVRLEGGSAWARISVYRERGQLALKVEIEPNSPGTVIVKGNGYEYTIQGAARAAQAQNKLIRLPNAPEDRQPVDVTLEVAGQPVARATLRTSE